MKVVHGATTTSGGAGRAAYRIHDALRATGLDSSMIVAEQASPSEAILAHPRRRKELRYGAMYAEEILRRFQRTQNPILHSPAVFPGKAYQALLDSDADIINLHWVAGGYVSIEQIGKLLEQRRVVWTLHDMWAFCGAEHYDEGAEHPRWKQGYTKHNRPSGHTGIDLDRVSWLRKLRSWEHPAHIITPSTWLAECVKQSKLMCEWPVTVIPNPIDTDVFRPYDKGLARDLLGLPSDVPLVMFGAIGGSADPRKGWDLLKAALPRVVSEIAEVEIVVIGQNGTAGLDDLGVRVHSLGYLHDDLSLVMAYNAADLVVVPSRQDNLPQGATEPQACGTPVVAFRTGGLTDIVEHGTTGFLAEPFEVEDLAFGILITLEKFQQSNHQTDLIRLRSDSLWSQRTVGKMYRDCLVGL
jgi:glycosyltransferase involved in cell wall biosynthesis